MGLHDVKVIRKRQAREIYASARVRMEFRSDNMSRPTRGKEVHSI